MAAKYNYETDVRTKKEEARQEGMEQGEVKTLYGLVCDGTITLESAASRKNLTVGEFRKKLEEFQIV